MNKPTLKERLEGKLVFNSYWCFDPRSGLVGGMVFGTPLFLVALIIVLFLK